MPYDLWTNGEDTYVAESAEQAMSLAERDAGSTRDEEGWSIEDWYVRAEDPLTINLDETGKTTKSKASWIAYVLADQGGPGMLCSVNI